jgi:hypothetical protein
VPPSVGHALKSEKTVAIIVLRHHIDNLDPKFQSSNLKLQRIFGQTHPPKEYHNSKVTK